MENRVAPFFMYLLIGVPLFLPAIIAVILTDQAQAVAIWQTLLELGLYVNMARPPATPAGTFLLRCSLCADHSDEQVEQIIGMFKAAGQATGAIDKLAAIVTPESNRAAACVAKGRRASAPRHAAGGGP